MKNLITLTIAVFMIAYVGCDKPTQTQAPEENDSTAYKVNDWKPVASITRQDEFNVQYDEDEYNSRPIVKNSLSHQLPTQEEGKPFVMKEEPVIELPAQMPSIIASAPTPADEPSSAPKQEVKQDPVVTDLVDELDKRVKDLEKTDKALKDWASDDPKSDTSEPTVQYRTETRYRRVARTRMRETCGPMGTCRLVPETFYVNEPYTVQVAVQPQAVLSSSTCPTCGCTCGADCPCKAGGVSSTFSEGVMPLSAGTLPLFTETRMTYENGPTFYDSGFSSSGMFYDSGFTSSGNWFRDSNGNQFTCDNCPAGTARNTQGNFVPIKNQVFGSGAPMITAFQNAGNRIKARRQNRRQARCQRWGF